MDSLNAHAQAVEDYLDGGDWWVAVMYAAYCKRIKADPLDVALVETVLDDHTTTYHYAVLVWDENDEPISVRRPTRLDSFLEVMRRIIFR